jgi:drug/metabolite transporter (DMT)-like permease
VTVVFALMAAAVYGVAVALQNHEAALSDPGDSLRPRLLLGLMARPLWLLGVAGDIGGFALQTAALALGSLIVVQPILTLALVVSLMLGTRLDRRPLRRRDWVAVAATLSGLSVFLGVARPTEHSSATASTAGWLTMVGVIAAGIVMALTAGRASEAHRATLYALAAAFAEAVMAVFAKAFGEGLGRGAWRSVMSWECGAVVVCGIITMLLVQSAYQVGQPTATLPVLTVAEPIVAIGIGIGLFGEHVHLAGWRAPVVAFAGVLMIRGLMAIATRSEDSAPAAFAAQGGSS